jgi:DNA mismatch repair protein MutL
VIHLPKDELTALLNNGNELDNLGFLVEEFGATSVIIREVPSILSDGEIEDTIKELAEYFKENKGQFSLKSKDELYHKIACKAAVKAGTPMNKTEMEAFVKKLLLMPDIKYCPHGRPIIAQMTKYQFEKLFKRIV